MVYIVPFVLVVGIALLVFYARNKSIYYGKMFSDEHYTEIGNWLVAAMRLGPVEIPSLEDHTALSTSAECTLSYTRTIDIADASDRISDRIHIAFSQKSGVTTHAASSRIAFFLLQMLKDNKADAAFFYRESGVHHMVFGKEAGNEWLTRSVADALEDMALYQPIVFLFDSMQDAEMESAQRNGSALT